jgi:hypothetical protein
MPLSRVHHPASKPLREIRLAAVAVGQTGNANILHAGIFFADNRGPMA